MEPPLSPAEFAGNACRWIGLDESQARSLFSRTVADLFEIELPILK
jgi:hypothetical protein